MSTLTGKHRRLVADDYFELVRAFPLRTIRSEAEHHQAVKILSRLLGRPGGRLSEGERDYAQMLGRIIDDFGQHGIGGASVISSRKQTPLEILRFLLQENGMTVADLGRVLGNRTAASLVLSGKRELNKSHIRRLAARFKVDGGLFLGREPRP